MQAFTQHVQIDTLRQKSLYVVAGLIHLLANDQVPAVLAKGRQRRIGQRLYALRSNQRFDVKHLAIPWVLGAGARPQRRPRQTHAGSLAEFLRFSSNLYSEALIEQAKKCW